MKQSARNIPTGPGSRGGRFHEREYRLEWFRLYRKTHPEYIERENARLKRRREKAQEERRAALAAATFTFTEDLREMVREELKTMSCMEFSRRTMVTHATILRFVGDWPNGNGITSQTVDALVAYFGLWRIARHASAGRKMRLRGRT